MTTEVPGRRERKKQERRAHILKCAQELFDRQGYHSTSVEQIADAADVAFGTIYNFFPTKLDILMTLTYAAVGDAIAQMDVFDEASQHSLRDAVERLLRTQCAVLVRTPREELALSVAQAILAGASHRVGEDGFVFSSILKDQLQALIARHATRGELPPGTTVETLTNFIFTLMRGLYFNAVINHQQPIEKGLDGLPVYLDIIFRNMTVDRP